MPTSSERAARDHRAVQLNPEHPAYYRARGYTPVAAARAAEATRRQNAERIGNGADSTTLHNAEAREAR